MFCEMEREKTKAVSLAPKEHYVILDGLRGVAALMVLVFHVFDACTSNIIPHGYLAVDMFFVLSGFVIGYSYDDRWEPSPDPSREGRGVRGMSLWTFFKRRLIRLHPMVLVGGLVGGIIFLIQGRSMWDGTVVSPGWTLLSILCCMFLLPALPGSPIEVRGFGEYFPLNGPFWSLFYEYIGNICYALLLRRLSNRWLAVVAAVSGAFVLQACLHNGYLGVGWSATDGGWWFGFVRMLFPYTVGLLMARTFQPLKVRNAFFWCSLLILAAGLMPTLDFAAAPWANGLYDFLCAALLFPAIVWIAASDSRAKESTLCLSRHLGDLSYPLYAIHYPFMCLLFSRLGFDGNVYDPHLVLTQWPLAVAITLGCPVLAWLLLKYYDQPLRRWLSRRTG